MFWAGDIERDLAAASFDWHGALAEPGFEYKGSDLGLFRGLYLSTLSFGFLIGLGFRL